MILPFNLLRRLVLFRRSWVGIDAGLGRGDPVVAVLRTRWGRLGVRSMPWRELPEALRRQIASGVRCAAALPASEGLTVRLSVPPLIPSRRRSILPGLLDVQLPFSLEDCAYAFSPTKDGAIGLAVRHADLQRAIAAWQARGCDPERIVPLEWILWTQALREHPCRREEAGPAAEASGRRIVVLGGEGDRLVVVAGEGGTYATAARVPVGDGEAFRRTLAMAFGRSVEPLLCLCAGPGAEALARTVEEFLEGRSAQVRIVEAPELFVARGLAWDGVEDGGRNLQLRRPPHEHPATARAAAHALRRNRGVALASALLLLGASMGLRMRIAQREKEQAAILADQLDAVAGYRVATRGARGVEEALAAFEERLDPVLRRFRRPGVAQALATVLEQAAEGSVRLTHLALADRSVTLSGRAPSRAEADRFEARLREAGLAVRMQADPRPDAEGEVLFFMTPEAQE